MENNHADRMQNENNRSAQKVPSALSMVSFIMTFIVPIFGIAAGIADLFRRNDGRDHFLTAVALTVSPLFLVGEILALWFVIL